ncbi:MAG: hypothetical protein AAF223_22675, partial [Bacteroidota bacterium]
YNNAFTRSLNFLGVQFYLGAFAYGTLPHEYFGHYSRAKEFDIQPDGYEIFFPSFGGNVPFSINYETDAIHRQMISAAGPELTTQIAYEAIKTLYSGESVPAYYGMYLLGGKLVDSYIYARNDLDAFVDDPAQYLRDAEDYFAEYNVPNDPVSYLLALVEQYGYYDELINPEDTWATFPADPSVLINDFVRDQRDRIRRAYLLQLLDPAILYALYGNYRYLVKDELQFKLFMFRVQDVQFMPSIRANLGHLGVENYYDLFVALPGLSAFNVYYRHGGNQEDQLNGAGIEWRNLSLTNKINLTAQLDYWRDEQARFNGFATLCYPIAHRWALSGSVGYKSEGSLMGKPFDEGFYGYGGLRW